MNRNLQVLSGMLLFLFLVSGALAFENMSQQSASPDWWLAPQPEMDEEFTDSLYYHNFTNSIRWYTAQDYLVGQRLTVPSDFTIEGFRILLTNPTNATTVAINVYENNNGNVGNLIAEVWNGAPTSVSQLDGWDPPPPGWAEFILDEEDYISIDANESFWVVIGPIVGENVNNGWHVPMDGLGAVPGDRNVIGYNLNQLSLAQSNYVINVGGSYAGEYVDLKAHSLFNDVQRFQIAPDTDITFGARFLNAGTLASNAGTVTFSILDTTGAEVWTNQADARAIDPLSQDTVMVQSTEAWTPEDLGRYIVTATISVDNEEQIDNNGYTLLQQIVNEDSWMIYDDGEFEVNMNPQTGRGWGVSFYPLAYPARIDSMSFYFEEEHQITDLRAYTIDANGETEVWNYIGSVVAGWNKFAIEDLNNYPEGININEGFFIGGYIDAGHVFHADANIPISAENPDMPDVSSSIVNNTNYIDEQGNWGVRARMGRGVAPDLVFNPDNVLYFHYQEVGVVAESAIEVENQGDGIAEVTQIRIGVNNEQFTILNDFPMSINPGTTESIYFEWTPVNAMSVGDTLSSVMIIDHNDITEPPANPLVVQIRCFIEVNVNEVDAEIPTNYFLAQNFPNPFNPSTAIRFGVREAGHVTMSVYNLMGQEVATLVNEKLNAGTHEVTFNAEQLSSGVYFYSLNVNGFKTMKKMAFVR